MNQSPIEKMRAAGKLAAQLLVEIESLIKPGTRTLDLDIFTMNFLEKHKAISACLNYKGKNNTPFPKHICTSVNHVICHGIPSEQILQEGDIIGVDVTVIVNGYHGDTCRTYAVGAISENAKNLIEATKDALNTGIAAAQPGNHIGDIGHAIESLIKNKYNNKYSIVEDYCGHGIGNVFHAPPEVQHVGSAGSGPEIKEGMFFTIEPMINLGNKATRMLQDNWTVISKDYSLSAQFEHTLGITADGPEIFTIY